MFLGLMLMLAATDPAYDDRLPPASDAMRFPSKEICEREQSAMTRHRQYLETQALAWTEKAEWFEARISECKRAEFLWELLADIASAAEFDENTCRHRLGRFRYWMGQHGYDLGLTPPVGVLELPPEKVKPIPTQAGNQ
jgi:hypothetical protein